MKKNSKKKTIISVCILIPLILIIGTVLGVGLPLVLSYYNNAYEKGEIVERTDEYIRPEKDSQPAEWENVTLGEDDLGKDLTEPETLANNVNASGTAGRFNKWNSFGNSKNAISVYGRTPIYKVKKKDSNIENVLVLGTDSRDVTVERGRSDSIIILSYNKLTGAIKMVSILRDSLVPIEGRNWNRINAAYSFDGVGLAVNTVNQVFNLDIQRFVVIDFNGVKDFINKVGGVKITLTQAEANYYNKTGLMYKTVEAGPCQMNGAMALSYMRTRKLDSDFGRTARQRKLIQSLATKIINEKNLVEIYDLTDFAFKLVKTNITLPELTYAVTDIVNHSGLDIKIESQHVPYSDAYAYKYYNGMAIISFDIDDAAARVNKFIYTY